MKGFNKLLAAVIVIMAAAAVLVNIILITGRKGDESRPYRVEAERIDHRGGTGCDSGDQQHNDRGTSRHRIVPVPQGGKSGGLRQNVRSARLVLQGGEFGEWQGAIMAFCGLCSR